MAHDNVRYLSIYVRTVLCWANSHHTAKHSRKMRLIDEAGSHTGFQHGHGGSAQELFSQFDPLPEDVLVRAQPHTLLEEP